MKKALILGCSHAYGNEMLPWPHETKDKSYPALIAQELGYEIHNLSIPGGSNDAIFRIFDENKSWPDLIIACWSGYNRSEVWDSENNYWQAIAPGKEDILSKDIREYQKQWVLYNTDERYGRLNKIKNIVALNSLAIQTVINIDSFWPVSNFTWPESYCRPVKISFMDWCLERKYPHTVNGHFFSQAHQDFARFVLENIEMPRW